MEIRQNLSSEAARSHFIIFYAQDWLQVKTADRAGKKNMQTGTEMGEKHKKQHLQRSGI